MYHVKQHKKGKRSYNNLCSNSYKRSPWFTGRSSIQAMERGPGITTRGLPQMTTLTYRGTAYHQQTEIAPKQFIELTYRQRIYKTRQKEVALEHPTLTYRGIQYIK